MRWEFGDGASSTVASPTHQYQSAGDYQVTLTVTNADGATVSGQFTVQVRRSAMVQGAACSGGEGKGWCWQRPLPAGNQVNDLYFHDANLGWAVGDAGQILKTTDGGTTWVQQHSPVNARLTQVRFADANVGWAVGRNGAVLRTVDGGITWTRQAAVPGSDELGITVIDAQRAVLLRSGYAIASTQDGGQNWRTLNISATQVTEAGTVWSSGYAGILRQPLGAEAEVVFSMTGYGRYLERFAMGSESTGLLQVYDYYAYPSTRTWHRTTDGGRTWPSFTPVGLPHDGYVAVLDFVTATDAWAVADYQLLRSTDAGSNWVPVALPDGASPYSLTGLVIKDSQTVWFSQGGGFYMTTDAGAHWTWLGDENRQWWADQLWASHGRVWIGAGEQLHVSTDQGATWRQALGPAREESGGPVSGLWFFDSLKGLAVSSAGWMLETSDGGRTWARQSAVNPAINDTSRLQFASQTTGWLSGGDGIRKTTDGGRTWWLPVAEVDMSYVADFHFVDANNGWALAGLELVRSTDGGASWQRQFSPPYRMRAVRFIDAQVGVMVGEQGTVMRTTDGGVTWSLRPSGVSPDLHRVSFIDGSNGWAVGEYGAVVRTTDGGLNWSPVATPAPSNGYWGSFHDVKFVDTMRGWLVGDNGLILSTVDGGRSWARQQSGTDRSLYSLFMLDAYTGWVGGSSGTLLATATAGD